MHARLAEARRGRPPFHAYPAQPQPPRQRTFYLFTGDNDFQNPAQYATISAELQAIGRHCLVYLDRQHSNALAVRPTVADIIHTFDEEIYPRTLHAFGQPLDVDRDGRFAILLTDWLDRLQQGRVSLSGFVRGSDLYADLPPPYGNRCDMMYLNAHLTPGPHLRTVLAHEYLHAVVFTEHVLGQYRVADARVEEESWLNEGLAHLAEEMHGYGWSNLDYRVSAFLNSPERYQLVVPDYYRAGLWRNPGNRGAVYLFLHTCRRRYGPDLPAQLVQSSLAGVRNLETATEQRFEDLFRQWSCDLLLEGSNFSEAKGGHTPAPESPSCLDWHRPLGGRFLAGPHFEEITLAGDGREVQLAGTSAAYLLLHSPKSSHVQLTLRAEPGVVLQATLIRLPEHTGRLALHPAEGCAPGTVRLTLTAHESGVTLNGAAWERLAPDGGRDETNYRPSPGNAEAETSRSWFGDPHLVAGTTRTTPDLVLPASGGSFVFKLMATDAAGHHLAAWYVTR